MLITTFAIKLQSTAVAAAHEEKQKNATHFHKKNKNPIIRTFFNTTNRMGFYFILCLFHSQILEQNF